MTGDTSRGHAVGRTFDAETQGVMPDAGFLDVHLLRHGAVEGFGERTVRGHHDTPLSAEGLLQHDRLVHWFAGHERAPDRVVCSDLTRCRDLGERLAARLRRPLEVEPALREQDMGDWEGRTWRALTAEYGRAVNDYWDDYVGARPPGGESLEDCAARVGACWDGLTARHDGSRLLVVTHTGVIRVLLCRALGLPLGEALRFAPPAASHTQLQLAAAGAVLSTLGERPWIDGVPDAPRPLGEAPRLALSGSAGTGKTTLGRRLADELGLPFLEEGMRRRLEGGLDLHRLRHEELQRLVEELWAEQCAAEDACPDGFVADRSPADFAAFWIFYGFHYDTAATERFLAATRERLARVDRVVLLPWGVLPLHSDGVRTAEPWTQFQYQCLVEGLLARDGAADQLVRVPPGHTELEARLDLVRAALGRRS